MNKKKLLALAPGCLIAMLFGSNVCADTCPSGFYVGFDVLKTSFSTKAGYGRNVFAKNPTAFNAFVGYKLPRNFFVEAGYEWTGTNGRTARITDSIPGSPTSLPSIKVGYVDLNSKIKIEHPYLGVGINYNLLTLPKVTLSALAGLSLTKVKAQYSMTGFLDNEVVPAEYVPYSPSRDRFFSKRALTPLLKIGANYQFSQHVSMRITGEWHRMSNFKIVTNQYPNSPSEIRTKNSSVAGVGIVYLF